MSDNNDLKIAFIGAVGLPNRYGGFEAFLEHCAPVVARNCGSVIVTCDASVYADKAQNFEGVKRIFIPLKANGAMSVFHDLFAFFSVFFQATHIVVLGVSGGLWFPFLRFIADLFGKKILVNVDGVEWQRGKYGGVKRAFLWFSDRLSQIFAHRVIYDNAALRSYVVGWASSKATMIPYPGDYVLKSAIARKADWSALTICRIEPENNIEMLLMGALESPVECYTFVGNWGASEYGRALRKKYSTFSKLDLRDPIYDPSELAALRDSCSVYIHGHSVGGTNPSLVEMLFYDCAILCFDVPYHRETTLGNAAFFADKEDLSRLLANSDRLGNLSHDREALRRMYTRDSIASAYISACLLS